MDDLITECLDYTSSEIPINPYSMCGECEIEYGEVICYRRISPYCAYKCPWLGFPIEVK